MKAVIDVAQKAEIAHQIPESIFSDLAKRLTTESGYLEVPPHAKASGAAAVGGIYSAEVEERLDEILVKLDEISERLGKLEKKNDE